MRYLKYSLYLLLGGFLGLILGAFIGLTFNSFYARESEWPKQKIQMFVFGGAGTILGLYLGLKIASEEEDKRRKEIRYQKSLKEKDCNYCKQKFQFSTLEHTDRNYCDFCINTIKFDYITKCKEINKLADGIDRLKQKAAIKKRLNKIQLIAEELIIYNDVELDFITKKPTDILKSVDDYYKELGE